MQTLPNTRNDNNLFWSFAKFCLFAILNSPTNSVSLMVAVAGNKRPDVILNNENTHHYIFPIRLIVNFGTLIMSAKVIIAMNSECYGIVNIAGERNCKITAIVL